VALFEIVMALASATFAVQNDFVAMLTK